MNNRRKVPSLKSDIRHGIARCKLTWYGFAEIISVHPESCAVELGSIFG